MLKIFGWLFLVGWVAGQIFRWPGWPPVTMLDVAVGGMVIAKIREIRGIRDIRVICLILVISWILGLRLFSTAQALAGGLYLLRFLGYLWVIANAGKLLAPVKKFIIPAFWIFVILAWVQYLFLPDTKFLLQYGWDEHYYRMIGTVLDPNYLGVMLAVIGIYAIKREEGRGKREEGEKIWKRSNFWLAVLALGGLVVTFSRASWLATIIGLTAYLVIPAKAGIYLNRFRIKFGMTMKILMGLLIIGLVLYVVPKPGGEGVNLFRTASIEQRVESWKEGINVWWEHPWLGVGFNNYAVAKARGINHAGNAPSSSWILLLATIGVIGLGWLSMVGWLAVRNLSRLWIGILMMIGVHAVFNNTMFYPPVLGLLALIKAANAD